MKPVEYGFICYTDGASRGNPGLSAYSYIIVDPSGRRVSQSAALIGTRTNNYAEYRAVIEGLCALSGLTAGRVCICSDSELVIRQVNGVYRIKAAHLRSLHEKVEQLAGRFEQVTFFHARRDNPFIRDADALCNRALDESERPGSGED